MTLTVDNKFQIELKVNNIKVDLNQNVLDQLIIHEGVNQSLPTMDLSIVNDGSLVERDALVDGSQIDVNLTILQTGDEETLEIETILWSHEIVRLSEGYQISLHCVLSAPDFLESRIESVNGSSTDVFRLMADRSRMKLISDSSIDKQVWIRPGIRGNIWLNDVINHSWASPKSAFIYVVTRQRELLRYNLDERASRKSIWTFQQDRLTIDREPIEDNIIRYETSKFSSQSGFLNSHFGYGKKLSNFDVDLGTLVENQPREFTKRTKFMNLNSKRELPQRSDSLGFGNSLNVHENYFNAFSQNMRIKSFYSVTVDLLSTFFRDVRLLDRVTLQVFDEASESTQQTFGGEYFIDKISTIVRDNNVFRRFSLVREGYNAEEAIDSK